ncbi:MAG TPA: GTPase [Caulifigura sp.]|nr:GTPase [Caulifigura sp.]
MSRATTLRAADLLLHQAAVAWPSALAHAQGADAPRSPELRARAAQAMEWAGFGRHLTEPWLVAIVGKPNAGKSSLMNALAGFQRSIVNPTPGTTRDAVTLDVAFDGWPVRLVDTAGLREGADELESIGINRARQTIDEADLVLQLFDVTETRPGVIPDAVLVANKLDLVADPADATAGLWEGVSAKTGAGVERLIERIVGRLIPELPPKGLAIPVSQTHSAYLRTLHDVE